VATNSRSALSSVGSVASIVSCRNRLARRKNVQTG
jgi:hypothetical protein